MSGIGSKLERLLEETNKSVSEVAKATGVPGSTIYSIIRRDNSKVDIDVLQKIADYLGVSLDYFSDVPKTSPGMVYYLDDEAAALAQEIFERPELRVLMDASRKVSRDDIQFVVDMLSRMKKDDD